YVQALAGSDVDLWVGTLDGGVRHWHAGTTDVFAEEQGLPDRQVQAITLAGDKAYVGTPLGVAEFDGGRFSGVLANGVLVTCLHVEGNELWIGSEDQGVVRAPLASNDALILRTNPQLVALNMEDQGVVRAPLASNLRHSASRDGEDSRQAARE